MKPILSLDFDGVLHSYTSGWQGAETISDPPVPGAMQFLYRIIEDFDVYVYSSRSNQEGGIEAIMYWLNENLTDQLGIEIAHIVASQIKMASVKPPAFLTIDDRAIQFTGEWPSTEVLLSFKPWNKQ